MPESRPESAPAGWEASVEKMKGHPEISNSIALAHWMHKRGYRSSKENGEPYSIEALTKRAKFDAGTSRPDGMKCATSCACKECGSAMESMSASALGALTRKGVRPEALRESEFHGKQDLTNFTVLREADASVADSPRTPRVVLMSAGPGNRRAGNFYPPEILKRDYKIFEGVKCFLNHPGALEEKNRPERDVEQVSGWFSEVEPSAIDGASIIANLNYCQTLDNQLTEIGQKTRGYVESALVYKRQYPNDEKVLLGFSINAAGPTHIEQTDDLIRKYPQYAESLRSRPYWNVSDGIELVQSVDLVTFPARGGRVLGLREAEAFVESCRWRCQFEHLIARAA